MRRAIAVSLMVAALGGCKVEPLPERQPVEYEDFGTEVYRVLHQEMRLSAHAPEAKMAVLAENREDMIWALNRVIDAPVDAELQAALVAIVPHYDQTPTAIVCGEDAACDTAAGEFCDQVVSLCIRPGKLPRITRRLQSILALMQAPQFDALAKITASHGAPPDALNRLAYRLLTYEQELFPPVHNLVMEREASLTEILRWAHRKIQTLEDSAPVTHPTFAEKLLKVVTSPLDTGGPAWAIVLDENGNPVVNEANGAPLGPYVDANGDGVVDVDAEGDPVDALGQKIKVPVFSDESHRGETRDADGRAQSGSQSLFQYFDVKKTLLGMLFWNLHPMVQDGVVWDLFTSFEGLLGPKITRQDEDGPFPGFDADQNPILDLLYAFREIRRYPRLPQLLQVLSAVVQQNPDLVGQLLTELGETIQIFKGPDRLTPGNNLFDDLHPELEHWAKSGLLKEVLLSFQDPRIDGLPAGMFNMMVYTDLTVVDADQELDCGTVSACQDRIAEIYTLPYAGMTRWDQPDDTLSNQSIQQKFLALVWDVFEERYTIDLFNILPLNTMEVTDDMATYYASAMAGVAELGAGGIDGSIVVPFIPEFEDKYPSAEEFGLFMNHSHGFLGDAVCKQGYDVKDHYGRYLLALQRTGAAEGFKPLAEAFARLDDVHAFTKLFTVLHFHYGSTRVDDPEGILTQHGTNFRALEEPLARMISETALLPRAIDLVRALIPLTVSFRGETLSAVDELDGFLRYLLDTDAGLTTRSGETWVPTGDGAGRVEPLSRFYLLLHAFDRVDAMLESNPLAKAAWDRIDLLGYLLGVDAGGNLKNPTTVPLVLNLVPILADELSESFYEPTYLADLDEELADLEEFFGSRGFAYLYDVMVAVRDAPSQAALKSLLDNLLLRITDASRWGDEDLFGAVLAVLSDVIQSRIDVNAGKQLLRWFGEVITPDDRCLFELVELINYLYEADPQRTFTALAKNLFKEQRPGVFAINVLGRVIKAIHRVDPAARGPYTQQDFEHIISGLADYLVDEERGLERMYTIVHNRN